MFFLHYERRQSSRPADIDPQGVIRKLTPFAPADQSGCIDKGPIRIVQCVHWNTAPSRLEPAPLHDPSTGISLASWARIDNRGELAEKLGLAHQEMGQLSDTGLILHAYLKWEEDCVLHLLGDFVFALHDPRKEQVFCGRDHLGVRPLYYYLSADRFVCATTLSALIDLEGVSGEIDRQWLADYLLHLSMSFDRTPYPGLLKLPPAHCLTVTPKAQHLRPYFRLSEVPELRLKDSREYVEAYREQLEAAIKCRVATEYPLGSELSGGLDSSAVTAFAARLFDQPLSRFHAFGFALSALEPEYILAVSRDLGLPQTHIFSTRELAGEDLGPAFPGDSRLPGGTRQQHLSRTVLPPGGNAGHPHPALRLWRRRVRHYHSWLSCPPGPDHPASV